MHYLMKCVYVLSHLSHVRPYAILWTSASQVPLSMGFSMQEYWSGLPCPLPGDLPNPEIKPTSPALAGSFFTTGLHGGSDSKASAYNEGELGSIPGSGGSPGGGNGNPLQYSCLKNPMNGGTW